MTVITTIAKNGISSAKNLHNAALSISGIGITDAQIAHPTKKMIDFNGLSYKEVISILKLMSVDYSVEGFGYAYEQNILSGEIINDKVIIKMKERYN